MVAPTSNRAWIRKAATALVWIVWLLNLASLIALLAYIVPRRQYVIIFPDLTEFSYSLIFETMPLAQFQGYLVILRALAIVVYVALAIIVFLRKRTEFVGALTSFTLISCSYLFMFGSALYYLNPAGSARLFLEFFSGIIYSTGVFSLPLLLYVFPDGSIRPRFLAWTLVLLGPLSLAAIGWVRFSPPDASLPWIVSVTLFFLLMLAGVIGQFVRYLRISDWSQRQQTKWVVFALVLLVIFALVSQWRPGARLMFEARAIFEMTKVIAGLLVILFLPISIAISILKHRLYDIDLIVRRTLQYSILTGVLVLIYFSGVVSIQSALGGLSGVADSPVVVVVTTLGVAGLFNPLRIRIQDLIDRRFFRARYDAEQVLAGFAHTARDVVDLDHLAGELIDVVGQTVRPVQTSLWLKGGPGIPPR